MLCSLHGLPRQRSLEADTVIDDFPEPEGEPLSDKEIEEAMGIKEPEENK